jgi:hypothetical protein
MPKSGAERTRARRERKRTSEVTVQNVKRKRASEMTVQTVKKRKNRSELERDSRGRSIIHASLDGVDYKGNEPATSTSAQPPPPAPISDNLQYSDFPVIKKKTKCVVKTHDRSETFVLQGNIVIILQSLLNSIFATKLYILMKKINYKQR